MRTVYLGTSEFAATVLERLARSDHAPALVLTRPDRPRGRGRRPQSPPVAETARALGVEVEQPADVNADEARRRIAAARPEAVCICAYGALIREPLLSEHEMLNVHPSLLPRWRGAAPVERAIEAGDPQTGVSIMRPVAELDAGPVFLARAEPIRSGDDYGSLSERLAELSAGLLVDALETMPEPQAQPARGVTYAAKIGREDRRLDPKRAPQELARLVRALTPHIGAYAELPGGERLGVRRAQVWNGGAATRPGELRAHEEHLVLGAEGGAIELLEVLPAGGRLMDAADYLRGHRPAGRQDATRV